MMSEQLRLLVEYHYLCDQVLHRRLSYECTRNG